MPARARRLRGKHSGQGKKKKGQRRPKMATTQSVVVSPTAEAAALSRQMAPAAGESPPEPVSVAAREPDTASEAKLVTGGQLDIVAELRRVGVLAAIIVAILVVLAFALS